MAKKAKAKKYIWRPKKTKKVSKRKKSNSRRLLLILSKEQYNKLKRQMRLLDAKSIKETIKLILDAYHI